MTRIETDSFGPIEVPESRLWGAQTQRSLVHFRIGAERMPLELLSALARLKKHAAAINGASEALDARKASAIAEAASEVMSGAHWDELPLSLWQTGSGTQTNMNLNEVLANRASELLGGVRGQSRLVHPNDDVNLGQSSNDVFPSAMQIAAVLTIRDRVIPALTALAHVLREKARAFQGVVKIGRTHLMDATPLTLGQEISGWVSQLHHAIVHVKASLPHLSELALGGTAVGTGLNGPPGFAERVIAAIAGETDHPFVPAPNKFEALAASDGLVFAHGALRTVAACLFKITNDVRWLASGPRCGIGEITIPANEPGSSIMPGKVNPTQAEALTMVCARVFGNDVTIGFAGASGNFELNVFRPVMIDAFLQSARLIADGSDSFREHCVIGLEPNRPQIAKYLAESLMLVTALSPHLGYDKAAAIAKLAHERVISLREAALSLGVTPENWTEWVKPEAMVGDPARDVESG